MLNSIAIQARLQALADLARAGSTHASPVRPAQETGDSHECIFAFRYLFWRDAGKIAHGRFKSSDLLMGRIDQAIPTCVHYMRGPGPKWYEKNERNREAAGIVRRPAILTTG